MCVGMETTMHIEQKGKIYMKSKEPPTHSVNLLHSACENNPLGMCHHIVLHQGS